MARRRHRALVAAIGWTGHLFPALALARELHAREHEVMVLTWERWRDTVEGTGLRFAPSREYLPAGRAGNDAWGPALAQVARSLLPTMQDFRPDVVVSDLFTLEAALAAQAAGVRSATLIPHVYPVHEPGLPFYLLGLLPPRTPLGAGVWRGMGPLQPLLDLRHRRVRRELNLARAELGLPRLERLHGAVSQELAMVATFPQLEYPRTWPAHVHVTGPMFFDLPHEPIELPAGEQPLVFVASSTGLDPELRLLSNALGALDGEPVRVVASTVGREWEGPVADNTVVADWVSHEQVLSQASVVVCRGGHGTVTRAVAWGVPVLVCPAGADMGENGARVTWAGAGLMLPRWLLRPGPLRWAIRRLLSDRRFAARARAIGAWSRENDGAARGASLLERYATP